MNQTLSAEYVENELNILEAYVQKPDVLRVEEVVDVYQIDIDHDALLARVGLEAISNPEIVQRETDLFSYARDYQEAIHSGHQERSESALNELATNVSTYIFEGIMRYGHISVIETMWDPIEEVFVAGHTISSERFARGELAAKHQREKERRPAETRTELIKEKITAEHRDIWETHALVTISPYVHGLADKQAEDLGYSPSNQKYMIRVETIDKNGICKTEQLAMSGSDLDLLNKELEALGVVAEGELLDDVQILNRPFLMNKSSLPEGVATLGARLDARLEAETGREVFAGGQPNGDTYKDLEAVSRAREQRAAEFIESATQRIAEISGNRPDLYRQIIRETVIAICAADRDTLQHARDAIGEKAYESIVQAELDHGNSSYYLDNALDEMEEIVACGGGGGSSGSCEGKQPGDSAKCPGCSADVVIEGREVIDGVEYMTCPVGNCKWNSNNISATVALAA